MQERRPGKRCSCNGDAARRTRPLASTGHPYLSYAATGLAVCAVLVLVALALTRQAR